MAENETMFHLSFSKRLEKGSRMTGALCGELGSGHERFDMIAIEPLHDWYTLGPPICQACLRSLGSLHDADLLPAERFQIPAEAHSLIEIAQKQLSEQR